MKIEIEIITQVEENGKTIKIPRQIFVAEAMSQKWQYFVFFPRWRIYVLKRWLTQKYKYFLLNFQKFKFQYYLLLLNPLKENMRTFSYSLS